MAAKILVIEDHPANIELMELLLTAYHYDFIPAGDGEQGIEAAERTRPDLVVCDIHLPKLDGFGVLAAFKRHSALRFTPVLAVSALAMVGDRERLLAAGFDGYISKPIDPETFIAQIEPYLPKALRSTPPTGHPDSVMGNDLEPQGPLVLVVDDAHDGREELRAALESFDFRVLTSASVDQALACLRDHPTDLVLCDSIMPLRDGWDLLQAMREDRALARIPVVLITVAQPDPARLRRAAEAGAADFLHRPLPSSDLAGALHACLARGSAATRP